MCSGEVSQSALDAIAGDRVSNSPADDESNARTGLDRRIFRGRDIVRSTHGMDDQRGPTRSKPSPSRPSEVFRVVHSQQSRQHRWPAGGFQADRRARPLRRRAEMIARPARVRIRRRKPWVRLRRRLLGWNVRLLTGKLPPSSGTRQLGTVLTRHASQAERAGSSRRCKRPSNGTGHRQTGQTGANSGGLRNSGRRCPVDTPNTMANIADSLASRTSDC
jgi:hypothetical protein